LPYDLRDRAGPNALCAGQDSLVGTIGGNANALEIRLELAGSDASYLGTDATQVLPFATDRYRVADLGSLTANFALSGHVAGPSFNGADSILMGKLLNIAK
jgi:hypothetical protein